MTYHPSRFTAKEALEFRLLTTVSSVSDYELQVNSYLHAKVLGESCVNGLFSPQAGLPLHGKSARIIRLAGIGAALQFPYPGWGSGTPSSPLSALIATGPIGQEYLDTPVDSKQSLRVPSLGFSF